MKEKNNKKNEEQLEKTDVIEESGSSEEADDVTRKIDLNELYDGAVNNTVVIDPITNDEILLPKKKPNYTFIGVLAAIAILLILYYINNKSDLTRADQEVVPKKTTTINTSYEKKNGKISCSYQSKSDSETQEAKYVFEFVNNKLTTADFNYSLVVISTEASAVALDLQSQYEELYTNNYLVKDFETTFAKNKKGFTFTGIINYGKTEIDKVTITDNKTILYTLPNYEDDINVIRENYENQGFTCSSAEE